MHYCRNSDKHSFLRKVYGTNLGINVGGLAHMRFLVSVITCADIYNERPTLGCERCAGCDKTTTIEGMTKNPPLRWYK